MVDSELIAKTILNKKYLKRNKEKYEKHIQLIIKAFTILLTLSKYKNWIRNTHTLSGIGHFSKGTRTGMVVKGDVSFIYNAFCLLKKDSEIL